MLISILRQVLLGLSLGAPFSLLERKFAAHALVYRRVIPRDLGAYLLVTFLSIPGNAVVGALLSCFPAIAALRAPSLPLWASVPLAVVGSDFVVYWAHRLIHTRPLWRVHRWHHAPRHMYWLAGSRQSFLQGLIYTIPFLTFVVLDLPPAVVGAYLLFSIPVNHWMHSNIRFKWPWLEAVIVTPRIHHVHHSTDPRHYGRNFGSVFSIWDRMFGTFFDPDHVEGPLKFGIPERVSAPRMVLGV
jgi:sterol desaturase/sphingolipid hydroxylase (fatty acid hydroxylase superfamily)